MDFTTDHDGVLRSIPLLVELDGQLVPQMGLSLALRTLGVSMKDLVIKDRSVTPEAGADTLVWLASNEEPGRTSGQYFHQREMLSPSPAALDDDAARRLWEVSEKMVAGY